MDEIADPEMLEKMGESPEQELRQMKAFRMLSLRCLGCKGEVPTMVEVAKELKKIQRSLRKDSYSPSGETQFNTAQDSSSSVLLSSTKALLTCIACQVFPMGWWRKKKKKPLNEIELERGAMLLEDLIECCDGKSNPIKFFSADEICKATDNFSESNHLSKLCRSEYDWYSGKTENHHKILIKKYFGWSNDVYFCRDIAVSSMVSGHKNFRKLIGCCLEYKHPVMVYDGVKKHYELDDISEQPWKMRMKIAEDIATSLAYLHTAFPRPFVYRSMGLEDIFLDEDGVAELSDFSNCVSIPKGETFVRIDTMAGTIGYMDYKYVRTRVVSEGTDVFAIGVVMQNLLMGQERFFHWRDVKEEEDYANEEGDGEGDDDDDGDDTNDSATISKINDRERQFQSRLLKFMEEGKMDEIADPEMVEKMGEISEEELCKMKAFGMLSLRCTGVRGEVPTMVEVAKELKKIQRSLRNDTLNSSPSGETPFDSAQHSSSSVVLSNNSLNTKALLT